MSVRQLCGSSVVDVLVVVVADVADVAGVVVEVVGIVTAAVSVLATVLAGIPSFSGHSSLNALQPTSQCKQQYNFCDIIHFSLNSVWLAPQS